MNPLVLRRMYQIRIKGNNGEYYYDTLKLTRVKKIDNMVHYRFRKPGTIVEFSLNQIALI